MSWISVIFPVWYPSVISTELRDFSDESIQKQTVQYGSLEIGVIKDKRRHSDVSKDMPERKHYSQRNTFQSNSSLLGLLQESKDKSSEWRVIPNTNTIIIRQPERDSPSILPFYSNKSKNDNILNPPMQSEYIETIKTQFFNLGISTGASLQLFFVSFLLMFASASTNAGPIRELSHEYYPVFRGILLISFFFSLYGANIFIWRRSKVDYLQVIGASYTHTYQYVLRGSTSMAYITFTTFMCYFLSVSTSSLDGHSALSHSHSHSHSTSKLRHLWPALSVLLPFLLFICPWDTATALCFGVKRNGFKQRWGLIQEVGYVLISPFSEVTFLRSFIADIFCSMPRIFTDLQYTVCLYATGSFLTEEPDDQGISDLRQHAYHTCGAGSKPFYALQIALGFLPYYIRFCQSLRAYHDTKKTINLWNALKYFLSLTVTGLAVAHTAAMTGGLGEFYEYRFGLSVAWVVVGVITTLYSFYWDVVIDWGLGNAKCRHWMLREEISFSKHKYYTAIILDFVMRLGWVFVISPEQQYIQQNYMLLLSAVELMRRFLWAIYRVEWEHIVLSHKRTERNEKIKHDRLAALYHGEKTTLNFTENKLGIDINNKPSNYLDVSLRSSRSSIVSSNASNNGLSILSDLEERDGDRERERERERSREREKYSSGSKNILHADTAIRPLSGNVLFSSIRNGTHRSSSEFSLTAQHTQQPQHTQHTHQTLHTQQTQQQQPFLLGTKETLKSCHDFDAIIIDRPRSPFPSPSPWPNGGSGSGSGIKTTREREREKERERSLQ